ncbi:MAG: hypothetical protein K0R59_4502 [Sphingobacterium sp.]|nr:hypothetical protein [Sphingobacterium sp.]
MDLQLFQYISIQALRSMQRSISTSAFSSNLVLIINWRFLLRYQDNAILIVRFFPVHNHLLRIYRIDLYANIIGLNRNLSGESTIDQNKQLNSSCPSKCLYSIHRCPNSSSRPQDIINKNDIFTFYNKIDICAIC